MVDIERVETLDELMDRVPEDLVRDAELRRLEAQREAYHSSIAEGHDSMSKGPSKAKRIREFLDGHPEARNKDVVDALSQYGIKAADVANVKSLSKRMEGSSKKREPSRRGRPPKGTGTVVPSAAPAAPSNVGGASITLPELEAGVAFVKAAGSVMRAKHLLIIIEQVKGFLDSTSR